MYIDIYGLQLVLLTSLGTDLISLTGVGQALDAHLTRV